MANSKLLDPIHPGEILSEEFMKLMGISINKLARDIGVAPGKISAIVRGKRPITADTALRLAKYFRVSSEVWLGLQADYDRPTLGWSADRESSPRLRCLDNRNLMNVKLQAIPVVYFEEGAVIIAHCVPLDVSSCGHDLDEARRNIRDAVAGFIETCEEMGTLEDVLQESDSRWSARERLT